MKITNLPGFRSLLLNLIGAMSMPHSLFERFLSIGQNHLFRNLKVLFQKLPSGLGNHGKDPIARFQLWISKWHDEVTLAEESDDLHLFRNIVIKNSLGLLTNQRTVRAKR